MANRTVSVSLSAQVAGYVEGMEKAARSTREVGSEAEKLAQQQQAFEQMGRAAMVAGGVMAAGLALSAKAAIDWDSAWAGVLKTVDGSDAELAAVEAGLRDLTSVLPASHAEIAAVAEAAGQLGIQTGSVVDFTETMINLGETTNLSADEAATALARFMNVMGTSQNDADRLGSALVGLGNNFATTEREILEMSTRLAGSAVQVGFTEGEVMGLATALSSVGIEAEAGGSAMSKVMIDIAASVEEGGDRLAQFAQVAGVSADEFASKWRDSPGEALNMFVQGLANAEEQGSSTLGILAELGITEVRMRNALLGSAAASDQFAEAMAMGNEEFEKNVALQNEAELRYETTAAKLQIMANQAVDAAISLGQHFLPAIEAVAEGVGGFADMLDGLEGPMGAVVAWGGAIASAVLLGGGAFMAAVPKVAAYKIALETLGVTAQRTGALIAAVGKGAGLAALAAGVAAAGSALVDWAAEASGTKVKADELAAALDNTASAAGRVTDALAANSMQRFFDVDSAAVDNLRALDNAWGGLMANFESSQVGKVMTAVSSLGMGGQFGRAKENIEELDTALSQMVAAGNAEAAAAAQAEFAAKAAEAGWSTADITEALPQYGEALLASAAASDEASAGAESNVESLEDLQGAAEDTADEVSALADEISNFGSAQMDSERAAIAFQEQLEALNELVDSGTTGLDVNTESGRENRAALLDIAQAANESAGAVAAAGGTQDEVTAALGRGREALIRAARAFGMTESEAAAYADQLLATPDTVQTGVELHGVEAAKAKIQEYKNSLAGIQRQVVTVVNTITETFDSIGNADGGMYAYANGGIESYASGGFASGIYKGGAPIHKFAEPETGWEAYISGKPDQRDRNRQIWVETGNRLGMGGGQSTVYVPTSLKVYDADNRFIGTMGAVADQKINDYTEQASQAARRVGR